ncbi:unnamed protein product [Closterium sp. NIES-53]
MELSKVRKLARLLLTLATTSASTLRGCTSTSTTAAATSTTAAAASTTSAAASTTSAAASTTSTAATESPTPGATPTSTVTPYSSATTPPPPPPPPLLPLPLLLRRLPLGADAAPTSSVPTRSTAAAEATEGRRGTGEHPLKKWALL